MTAFCVRSECTIVLKFKREQRCVNIDVSYLHAFLVMTSSFDEQYLDNEWNDFINSNYATDYEDSTLFSSLNYFVNHDILKPNSRSTIFSQNLQTNQTSEDRISTSTCIDHVNLQDSLDDQDFSVKSEKTRSKYKEIKTLYEENTVVSTLLTSV